MPSYPDHTLQANQALTCYEFAFILNQVLKQINNLQTVQAIELAT